MGNVAPESLINIRYISGVHSSLEQELLREGQKAAERGETFSGCGVTVTAQESVSLSVAGSIARELGYGNRSSSKSDEDCEYISKECPSCHEKNVKTYETKTHITGKCGCSIEKKPPKAQLTDG